MAAYTTIDDPGLFYNTVLYTGNGTAIGSGGLTVTGVGFQADMTWIKRRNGTDYHNLHDAVRGAGIRFYTNVGNAEDANSEILTSWTSDGFTLGSSGNVNGDGQLQLAWNWKAGTTSGLSGGTITPSAYSINTTSGFGIYAYTGNVTSGATITHGLGIVPKLIIVKSRAAANSWEVFHAASGNGDAMQLNGTGAGDDSTAYWNDTSPTSSVFSLGNGTDTNRSGTMMAYVFAPVQGYSAMGSYVGNGNADGPFVYTGFRSAFLMIKNATAAGGSWHIYNNKVLGYNIENHFLEADGTTVEADDDNLDLLSNGFKIKRHTGALNTDGETYAYTAFAEQPFVNSSGVPCNAR